MLSVLDIYTSTESGKIKKSQLSLKLCSATFPQRKKHQEMTFMSIPRESCEPPLNMII